MWVQAGEVHGRAWVGLSVLAMVGPWLCGRTAARAGEVADRAPVVVTRGDGTIRSRPGRWTLETATVRRVLAFEDGQLRLVSFRGRPAGREMVPAGKPVSVLPSGMVAGKLPGPWRLVGSRARTLRQGELQLDIELARGPLGVVKSYVVYPKSSVIREWCVLRNTGREPLSVVPHILDVTVQLGDGLDSLDFHWMTGARNEPGCWDLRTRRLSPERPQRFDSYDPFPGRGGKPTRGDGVDARIARNGRGVWPARGWQFCKGDADERVAFDVRLDVKIGDRIDFIVGRHGNHGYDTTEFSPAIAYADGQTHRAAKQFGAKQGEGGWTYGCLGDGRWRALAYDRAKGRWTCEPASPDGTPFIAASLVHPGSREHVVRRWTAPRAGTVRVTGTVCNAGNAALGIAPAGHKMGSEAYAPWYALYDRRTRQGLVIGWDYMGHWDSRFAASDSTAVRATLRVAGYRTPLAPGESLTTPKAFVALYRDDLDNAGNELLDWQYRYLWDYTRPGWFPAIPMLHNWHKGTGWGTPGVPWWGSGKTDIASQFTKVFRATDLIRRVGADLYHRDWGWWDRAGDWNGPDFGTTGRYLRKHGMGQIIYAFLYTVDPRSKLARAHPEWLVGQTLDMSRPEVVRHIQAQLDDFHERFGDFAWRNDSTPTAPRGDDDSPLLAQDQNFRRIIRTFLDKYPRSSFQSVNGGGNEAGYDYVRLSGMFQFTDGGSIMPLRNYYASLLLPPDKLMDNGDQWRPERFDAPAWRPLLSMALVSTGDTWEQPRLEGLRELFDLYHYLVSQGVAGRWVKVYRPRVDGDERTLYLQRLSADRRRGLIVPARPAPGPVTLWPKGLVDDEKYLVAFHVSSAEQTRTGRDLMARGIALAGGVAGELVYLNLPYRPGNRRDRKAPTAPSGVVKRWGENMGFPGVELAWKPAGDDRWVSYYEVLRDGVVIDKVAKGTFYFDHLAGADLAGRYEVRTVDGSGNRSAPAAASGSSPAGRACIVDDADRPVRYAGTWRHERGLGPAHRETISATDEKGAAVEVAFAGRRVLWFSKLDDRGGIARLSVDAGPGEEVDTYCSDDVWGVCLFRKDLPAAGKHVLRVVATGKRNPRSKGTRIHFDGLRAQARPDDKDQGRQ